MYIVVFWHGQLLWINVGQEHKVFYSWCRPTSCVYNYTSRIIFSCLNFSSSIFTQIEHEQVIQIFCIEIHWNVSREIFPTGIKASGTEKKIYWAWLTQLKQFSDSYNVLQYSSTNILHCVDAKKLWRVITSICVTYMLNFLIAWLYFFELSCFQ